LPRHSRHLLRGMPIEDRTAVANRNRNEHGGAASSARLIRSQRSHTQQQNPRSSERLAVALSWRRKRLRRLHALANSLAALRWSSDLLNCLVDEIKVEEEFAAVLGDPAEIPMRRYPQAVAIAIALRHSWRPDLFASVSRRFRRLSQLPQNRRPRRSTSSEIARRTLPKANS
jgi:hypothetical protein